MSNMKLSKKSPHKFFTFLFSDTMSMNLEGVIEKVVGDKLFIRSNNGFLYERPLDKMSYPPSLAFYNQNIVPKHRVK